MASGVDRAVAPRAEPRVGRLLVVGTPIGNLGDLYKSQLREVAAFLGVPRRIIDKPPSADLWQGQTDEDELGATYEELDRILYQLVDRRWSRERLVAAGIPPQLVDFVAGRVARYEYKRQPPPVAKISLRTPGIDHLYPRRRPGSRRPS